MLAQTFCRNLLCGRPWNQCITHNTLQKEGVSLLPTLKKGKPEAQRHTEPTPGHCRSGLKTKMLQPSSQNLTSPEGLPIPENRKWAQQDHPFEQGKKTPLSDEKHSLEVFRQLYSNFHQNLVQRWAENSPVESSSAKSPCPGTKPAGVSTCFLGPARLTMNY